MVSVRKRLRMKAQSPDFESIKQISPYQAEYWSARDLAPLLGYNKWQNFEVAIQRAMTSCQQIGQIVADHFTDASKVIIVGKGAKQTVKDYLLSRFACYLIARAPVQGVSPSEVKDLFPCGNGECSAPYLWAERARGNIARRVKGETKALSSRRVPQSNLDKVKATLLEAQD
jgi:hypothetical protein